MRRIAFIVPVVALVLAAVSPAAANGSLSQEQKNKVEAKLQKEGFKSWNNISMDDKMIDVGDAVDASGKKMNLVLDPASFEIVKRKPE